MHQCSFISSFYVGSTRERIIILFNIKGHKVKGFHDLRFVADSQSSNLLLNF